MLKTLLILSSSVLSGLIANNTNINNINVIAKPEMADVVSSNSTSSTSQSTSFSEELDVTKKEKLINLYNGEILTIDTTSGSSIEKEIPETEDFVTLKIGKSITYEKGGLYFNSSTSASESVGFEVSNKYIITSISLTAICAGSERTVKLSTGFNNSSEKVLDTVDFKLTKNGTSTGELIEQDKSIPGGTAYYFVHNGSGVTLANIDVKIASNDEEVAIPPVIKGEDKIDSRASSPLSKDEIVAMYTATDSIDGEVEVKIKYDTGYFSAIEQNKFGEYKLTLTASDSSGNSSDKVITVNYYDDHEDFLPKIEGPSVIYKADNILLTLEDIKGLYTAKDVNGQFLEVKIENVNYLKSANKVGQYKVKISSVDDEKRSRDLTVSIHVVKGLKDMWYYDALDVHTTQYSKLTIKQLVNEYSRFKEMDVHNFEVVEDNYTDFTDVVGKYNVKVLVSTVEGISTVDIKVNVEEKAMLVKPQEKTVWDHIGSFFKAIWDWICGLFH